MQFSLLNLLGMQNLTALANGAGTGNEQGKNPSAELFAELLTDANAAGADLQQGQEQSGGELAHELVSNVTVAQDLNVDVQDDVDTVAIKGLLNHTITPEEARDLLAQMHSDAQNGKPAPKGLEEMLESIEAGATDVTVQDMLAHVPNPTDVEDGSEQRVNTLQRMMNWLQGALNPNAAPLEALAYANAASMFPDATAAQNQTKRNQEKKGSEEAAIMMPGWVRLIGEQPKTTEQDLPSADSSSVATASIDLPSVDLPETDMVLAKDSLILVATKNNTQGHELAAVSSKGADAFDAFLADLPVEAAPVVDNAVATSNAVQTSDTDAANVVNTTNTQISNEARINETVRIHHANAAYARSEVMDQVQVGVRQAFREGVDRITIQLNPHELGRVEVKMDIVADGMSQVSFLVDKQETFDLLQRDARALERMLQDAGIQADAGSMQFNLRQENQSKEPWGEASGSDEDGEQDISAIPSSELSTETYLHLVSDRVDIRA